MIVDEGRPAGGRTLRFTGGRFSAERWSDDAFAAAGRSLIAYREAIVELAKREYPAASGSSVSDIPPAISGFHFSVADLRRGSMMLDVHPDAEGAMFEVEDHCISSADKIDDAIAELGRDGDGKTLASLSSPVISRIAKIGAPLKGSEAVSFTSRRGTARLGQAECEILRRPRLLWDVALELIAGRALRISADRSRAALSVLGWETARPTSIYYKDLATIDDMRVALTEDEGEGSLVTAAGRFIWSAGRVKSRESASSLEEVIVHDEEVAEQMNALLSEIDELTELEDGWYDTDGIAGTRPHAEAILGARRLVAAFPHYELPYPHVFPAVDGGVSMEWTLGDAEASITFEDSSDTATVASWDASTDEHLYEEGVNVNCAFVRDWLRGFAGQPAR